MVDKLLFDRNQLLERVGNDGELVAQLMSLYIKQLSQILLSLQEAVDLENKSLVLSLTHKIKGSSLTICCQLIAQKALQIENHLKTDNFNRAFINDHINKIQLDAEQFALLSSVHDE